MDQPEKKQIFINSSLSVELRNLHKLLIDKYKSFSKFYFYMFVVFYDIYVFSNNNRNTLVFFKSS